MFLKFLKNIELRSHQKEVESLKYLNQKQLKKFDFPIEKLTKNDILELIHKHGRMFEKYVLKKHTDYLISLFNETELIILLKNSREIDFLKEMMSSLEKDIEKYKNVLNEILESLASNYRIHFFLEEVLKLSQKDNDFKKYLTKETLIDYIEFIEPENLSQNVCNCFLEDKEAIEYIFINIDYLHSKDLPSTLKLFEKSPYFNSFFQKYKKKIYWKFLNVQKENIDINLNDYIAYILILDEILEKEQMKFTDIKFLNNGSFSNVYKLNHVVLKIGRPHENYKVVNTPYLLKSLLRKQTNELNLYLEIAPLCDTTNITREDAYLIYKAIRQEGKVWLDVKIENLGRIIEANIEAFKELYVDPESLGFTKIEYTPRKDGEITIIDADFIEYENKVDFNNDVIKQKLNLLVEFEARYQLELEAERKML